MAPNGFRKNILNDYFFNFKHGLWVDDEYSIIIYINLCKISLTFKCHDLFGKLLIIFRNSKKEGKRKNRKEGKKGRKAESEAARMKGSREEVEETEKGRGGKIQKGIYYFVHVCKLRSIPLEQCIYIIIYKWKSMK